MVFVTGGTGLLGARLIFDLVSSGAHVKALRRPTSDLSVIQNIFKHNKSDDGQKLLDKIEWVEGDVLDYFSILGGLDKEDDVYHCAAMVSFNPKAKDTMLKVNIDGTANIVNACLEHGVRKFCFASSVAALGNVPEDTLITEKAEWKTSTGKSSYSISKYRSEQEVWRGMEEGLNAVIVNPSIIIGPGNWKRSSARMFLDVNNGLNFYTSGINGFVDVRDVTKSMMQLMKSEIKAERFIINGENLSFKEVFEQIADALGVKRPSRHIQPWLSEVAWRLDKVRTFVTRGKPVFSKEIAREAHKISRYSNLKLTNALQTEFVPLQEAIHDTAVVFLQQKNGVV